MWKYLFLTVAFTLLFGWATLTFLTGGHVTNEIAWYLIPLIVAVVTALRFKDTKTSILFWLGAVCVAIGGLGSDLQEMLVLVYMAGLGILAAALAKWLTEHVKLLAIK